jgi:prepilin-type N-terminal cleavage/methylation domain-containing protein
MKQTSYNMKHKAEEGFTLIEMIIYLSIVSVVLVSLSYLILDIIGGQTKSDAHQEVNYNIRFISDQLRRDITAAQGVAALTDTTLRLSMAGDDITYAFNTASSTLEKKIGSSASSTYNTTAVNVTGIFTDNSFGSRSQNVGVYTEVSYKNPDNLPDFFASSSAQFSVELRGRR